MTHIEKIDALIPEAEKIAIRRVREFGKAWNWRIGAEGNKFRWDYWTQFFHEAMNELCKRERLRG